MTSKPLPESNEMEPSSIRAHWLACGTLVVAVLLGYSHVLDCSFVNFDDDNHITRNPLVLDGLNWANIKAAFAAPRGSLWIPLTWISFMTEISVFGLNSGAMHAVNALLHAANAVLFFLLLNRATNRFWPSVAVAGLFALHPINVESVAWATERKNVLCLFFGFLSVHAYLGYARRDSKGAYATALVLFAFALLAKPMLVMLPAGLLLLDLWPFQRIDRSNWVRRILEKIPFLLISVVSSAMTMRGSLTAGTNVSFLELPLGLRLSNAAVSYGTYLRQFVWPDGLCVLYPYPKQIDPLAVAVSAAVLILLSFAAWHWRKQRPYLLVGWLWFLGMLVPMIGLVQVGSQAHADRFTYAAQIGIFAAFVWLIADLWADRPSRWPVYAYAVTAVALLFTTLRQVETWTNGATLFEHAIEVTNRNSLVHAHAGLARAQLGDYPAAIAHYRNALKLTPKFTKVWTYLSEALLRQNQPTEAITAARQALTLEPNNPKARQLLALALAASGDEAVAITEYRKLVEADPTMASAHYHLGVLLTKQGDLDSARTSLQKAAHLRPDDPKVKEALNKLAGDAIQ